MDSKSYSLLLSCSRPIVIFDLWQTILDSTRRPSELLLEIRNDFLIDINIEYATEKLFQSHLYLSNMPLEDAAKSYLSEIGLDGDWIVQRFVYLWKMLIKKAFLLPKSREVIMELRQRNSMIVLLSNSDSYSWEILRRQGLLSWFDYAVSSHETGALKPDHRCWEIIRARFNSSYNMMTMVGDSLKNDIEPARELGMDVVHIASY